MFASVQQLQAKSFIVVLCCSFTVNPVIMVYLTPLNSTIT